MKRPILFAAAAVVALAMSTTAFNPVGAQSSYTGNVTAVDCTTINVQASGPGQLTVSANAGVFPSNYPLVVDGEVATDSFSMNVASPIVGPVTIEWQVFIAEAGLPPGIAVAGGMVDVPECTNPSSTTTTTTTSTTTTSTTTTTTSSAPSAEPAEAVASAPSFTG